MFFFYGTWRGSWTLTAEAGGFWVPCVYQFHHPGILFLNMVEPHKGPHKLLKNFSMSILYKKLLNCKFFVLIVHIKWKISQYVFTWYVILFIFFILLSLFFDYTLVIFLFLYNFMNFTHNFFYITQLLFIC